jgi:hypothetical protein
VDKHRARAEAVADEIQPDSLRELLYYLVDNVLAEPASDAGENADQPESNGHPASVALPLVASTTS